MSITPGPPNPEFILTDNLVGVSVRTLIYGTFVLLYAQSALQYRQRVQRSWAQFWMFLISTVTFILATLHEAIFIGLCCISIHSIISKSKGLPTVVADRLWVKFPVILLWVDNIHIIINDAVVIWRAFVLLQNRRWRFVIFLLVSLLLLAFAATSLAYTILKSPYYKVHGTPPSDVFQRKFEHARYGLSLGINIVATTIMGCVYWSHRKDMTAGLGDHRPTQAERVMALLVESGVVFCISQALNFVVPLFVSATEVPGHYFKTILWTGYIGLASIYPTMVISLVNKRRTLDKMYSMDTSLQIGVGMDRNGVNTLQFAHSTTSTSMSQEAKRNNEQL